MSGTSNTGGLVGYNSSGSTVTNSFWDTQTSGQATSAGGTGKTTAQMKTLSTFSAAGWTIDDTGGTGLTWRIDDGYTSPLLRNFLTAATATYTANSKDVGARAFSLGGLYSNQQGYDITTTGSTVTITANNDSKSYSGVTYSGGNGVTYAGFAIGETSAVLGGTLTYGGTSQGAINVGTYSIDPLGLTSGNYALSFVSVALTITDSSQRDVYNELMSTQETTFIPQTTGSATLAGLAAAILVKDKTEEER